jgi:hypothetical protein
MSSPAESDRACSGRRESLSDMIKSPASGVRCSVRVSGCRDSKECVQVCICIRKRLSCRYPIRRRRLQAVLLLASPPPACSSGSRIATFSSMTAPIVNNNHNP